MGVSYMDYTNLGRAFDILHRKAQAFVTAACKPLKLTYSEYVLLMQIFITDGRTQDELAEVLKLDKSMITRTLSLLEKKAMVSRKQDLNDRRFKRIYVTERAKAEQEYLDEVFMNWIKLLGFDKDTKELRILSKEMIKAAETVCKADRN